MKPPKGALPLEVRHKASKEPAKGGNKPSASPRSLSAMAAGDCYYPRWAPGINYSSGTTVSYFNTTQGMTEAHDFWAQSAPGGLPPLTTSAWVDIGPCYVPPAPEPPSFMEFWPDDDAQVGTLKPTLGAWAAAQTGSVNYWFQLCSGDGPSSAWDWCVNSSWNTTGTWDVNSSQVKWGKKYWWSVIAEDSVNGLQETSSWMTLTAEPEQPSINSLLGAGSDGHEFDPAAGNYTQASVDASVATMGPPLTTTRTYNSLDPRTDGMFGAGWSTRWDMRLVEEPQTQTVLVTYPDGRQSRFGSSGNGTYVPPQGSFATLATVSGGGWRLMDKSATSYLFDAQGRVTKVTDNRGRAQDLTYGTDGKLTTVTATGGRSLHFTWTGAHATSVSTDPINGTAQSWNYTYDGDKLVKVCSPGSATACTTYIYGDASRYSTGIVNSMPTGYWRLNEATGSAGSTVADAVGWNLGGEDAEFSGGTYNATVGVAGALGGTTDTAIRFSGTSANSSYVQLPQSAISGRGSHLTVEAWFKTTNSGVVIGQSDTDTGTPSDFTPVVYVGTDGKLRGRYWAAGAAGPITTSGTVNNGQWHHVALSGDGSTQTLYLDGQAVGTRSGAIDHRDQAYTRVGSGYASSSWPSSTGSTQVFPFKGDIDEVAVFGRSLPAAEIKAHYQAGVAGAQMTKATLASGRVWAENTYNANGGRLLTNTDSDGGLWKIGAVQYSGTGEGDSLATVTVTDPHNGLVRSVYEPTRGMRIVSHADQVSTAQPPNQAKKTTYEYDTGGFPSKITDPNGNTTQVTHDERGNDLSVTTCRSAGNCQTSYTSYHLNTSDPFDPRNDRVTASRDARSTSSTSNTYATKFEYTAFGEKSKETTPATTDFPNGRSTTYAYTDGTEPAVGGGTTPAGLLKSETDPKGNVREFAYTLAGDLAKVTEPTGLVTEHTYDAVGRRTSTSQISGGEEDPPASTLSDDGLVASYGFNAGSGTAIADDSGHSQAGTATDTTWSNSGKFGKALSFNGTSSWVTVPDSPSLRLSDGMTVMAWVNPTVLDNWRQVLMKEFNGGLSYALYASNGSQPNGWAVNTGGTEGSVDSSQNIPTGTWSHLALTYDGSKLAFYLNGTKTAETNFTGALRADGGPLRIGGNGTWGEYFTGLIDEVRVYNRALSESEIQNDKDTAVTAPDPTDPPAPTGATTNTTTFTYDAYGRVSKQTGTGVKNQVSDVTHTAETRYTYDVDGNKLTETLADLTGADPSRTITYEYDTYGRVNKIIDAEGGTKLATYDHKGQMVSTTDFGGAMYDYGYTPRGQLASVTLKGWTSSPTNPQPAQDVVIKSYAYDPGGRMASQTDAMGRKVRYAYFNDNTMSEETAEQVKLNGSATPVDVMLASSLYDGAGNLTRKVTGGGKVRVDYVYDAAARLTSSTLDPVQLGRKTSYVYDANNNIIEKTLTATGSSRTEKTFYQYDVGNQLTQQTVENGASDFTTSRTVDDRGLITEITDPRGNVPGATRMDYTTLITYDVLGRTTTVQEPPVKVERNGAAAVTQRPTSRIGYNAAGEETHQTDPENRSLVTAYDKAGRIRSVTGSPYTPPGGTAVTPQIALGYDAGGRVITSTDPRGNVTDITYDVLGRKVRVTDPPATQGAARSTWDYTYTLTGEMLSTTDPTGARTEATYDGLSRQITATRIERKPTAAAFTTNAEYDPADHLIAVTQPSGDRIQLTVNAAGEVTGRTDALGHSSTFGFDFAGRQISVTDALGNSTVAEYDLAGRKIATKYLNSSAAVQRTYGFGYDETGNLTSQTSPEGHVTQRSYDAANRLVRQVEPVSASKVITTSFGYDAAGGRTRRTDGRGNVFLTTYNTLGVVESQIEPATQAHPNPADRTWTASYDAAGNTTGVLQPGSVRVTNSYDNLNRLISAQGSGAEAATQTSTFDYDDAGRLISAGDLAFTFNDRGLLLSTAKAGTPGTLSTFGYDGNDRLTQRTDAAGTAVFTYDAADRLKTMIDPIANATLTYGYDNADRLTGIDYGANKAKRTYVYDAMSRLTSDTLKTAAGANVASIGYGYDLDDNLTTKTTTGMAGAGTNTYTYDRSNRLISWTAPGGAVTAYEWDDSGNRTKAGSKTYAYDERSRLLSGDGTTYTYAARGTTATQTTGSVTKVLQFDAFDRMIADGQATYIYDALNRVTSRAQGTAVSKHLYGDLSNDIAATTDATGTKLASYSRNAAGQLTSVSDASGARLALADQHGDVVGTFDSAATALADSVAYSPFGEETARNGTRHDVGFQGEYTDPATGKVNMHARWYQPVTGTFASRDEADLNPTPSVQANRYTYANADPLSNTDPTGHSARAIYCSNCPQPPAVKMPGGYMCTNGICVRPDSVEQWWNDYINSPGFEYYNNPRLSDEEIKRLGYKYMPNGRPVEDNVPFWDMSPEAQELYMQRYQPTLTPDEHFALAVDSMVAADDEEGFEALYLGLPSGGKGVSSKKVFRALKSARDLFQTLKACHSHLGSKGCKVVIAAQWAAFMSQVCDRNMITGQCIPTKVGSMLGVFGIPIKLMAFLYETNGGLTKEQFHEALLKWAKKEGATCEKDQQSGLTVCGGLKSGTHFGNSGTTLGDILLTGRPLKNISRTFLNHEAEHMRQWNFYYNHTKFWPTFLTYYFAEMINKFGDICDNIYERQAEKKGKTYNC
ncbi:hypothetical protein Skr01_22000 [Sphaerisporangium krabiense]|nr:hypothetical protein Skr01_22000 [Sphaerisporangium krabiense]